ncbi:jg15031 [Pararge aegeria aegeria]|uniref:Jg15031 protein n=1 Tax=Pararge aegeria aegeria TaxID=348720 RepID=A0A8S4QYD6_9NEOP|nr:jg15031 [Pararge aegeria aegeria]
MHLCEQPAGPTAGHQRGVWMQSKTPYDVCRLSPAPHVEQEPSQSGCGSDESGRKQLKVPSKIPPAVQGPGGTGARRRQSKLMFHYTGPRTEPCGTPLSTFRRSRSPSPILEVRLKQPPEASSLHTCYLDGTGGRKEESQRRDC